MSFMRVRSAFRSLLLCLVLCAAVSGCGVSISPRISLPELPPITMTPLHQPGDMAPLVFVEEFSDIREKHDLVFYENRSSAPVMDTVGMHVSNALSNELRAMGFTVSESAPLLIRGEVRVWKAHVADGMPAFVSGEAVFGIQVIDPANKGIYSGTYRGYANLEESSVDTRDVQTVLATAMGEALKQFVKDKRLMGLLESF